MNAAIQTAAFPPRNLNKASGSSGCLRCIAKSNVALSGRLSEMVYTARVVNQLPGDISEVISEERPQPPVQKGTDEIQPQSRRNEVKKEIYREKEESKMEEGEVSSSPPSGSRTEVPPHRRVSVIEVV